MTRIRTLVHYTNPPALAGGCSVKQNPRIFASAQRDKCEHSRALTKLL